jgi:hypothetical protein
MPGQLLVVDYPGRRDESRIADLTLEADGWDVRYLVTEPIIRELTSTDFAAQLVARGEPFAPDIVAILAYCSAASIAQDLAIQLGMGRSPIPLLLFDGEPSPPENLTRDFGRAAANLCQVPTVDGVAGGVTTLTAAALTDRPAACVELMRGRLAELAATAFRADGADDEEAVAAGAASAEFYLDWLVYLVAAHNTSWPCWGGAVHHIASRAHAHTPQWPGSASTTLRRVDSTRNDLFHHPETRRLALSVLYGSDTTAQERPL